MSNSEPPWKELRLYDYNRPFQKARQTHPVAPLSPSLLVAVDLNNIGDDVNHYIAYILH